MKKIMVKKNSSQKKSKKDPVEMAFKKLAKESLKQYRKDAEKAFLERAEMDRILSSI